MFEISLDTSTMPESKDETITELRRKINNKKNRRGVLMKNKWEITEERKVAISDAIIELNEAEELVYEKDINVLKDMLEETK